MTELKAIYDSEDEIPETVEGWRDLFTKKGDKFELTGLAGLKTEADVSRVTAMLEKEKQKRREVAERLQAWGDLDHEDVQKKLDRIEELEAAAEGKLDDAKIQELADKRAEGQLNTRTRPLEREAKRLERELAEIREKYTKAESDLSRRQLRDAIRPVIVAAKILPEHYEDAEMYAELHLQAAEDGDGFFTREGISNVTPGVGVREWFAELLERKTGWLPPSEGGGARGSRAGGGFGLPGGADNPWSGEGWNLTKQAAYIREHGREKAERLAKVAGVPVTGGKRPKAKA